MFIVRNNGEPCEGYTASDDIRSAYWLQRLRASGYRLTEPRLLLITLISNAQRILNAEQLYELALPYSTELGKATVYRTLEKLEELKLIQRVHDAHGCHAFAPVPTVPTVQTVHQQILIFCQLCGRLDYLPEMALQQIVTSIQAESGWVIKDQHLQFSGICRDCVESKADG